MWTEARCTEVRVVSLEKLRLIVNLESKISRLLNVAVSGGGRGRQEEKVSEGHSSL